MVLYNETMAGQGAWVDIPEIEPMIIMSGTGINQTFQTDTRRARATLRYDLQLCCWVHSEECMSMATGSGVMRVYDTLAEVEAALTCWRGLSVLLGDIQQWERKQRGARRHTLQACGQRYSMRSIVAGYNRRAGK